MLFHRHLFPLVLLSFAFVLGCSAGGDTITPPAKNTPKIDSTHLLLKIVPDSGSAKIGAKVAFTLTATPALPTKYSIVWTIDVEAYTRTNVDTISNQFTVLGKHALKAVYIDSIGTRRDSTATIITITDTTSPPPPPPSNELGGFVIVVNHDTLDRAKHPTFCSADVTYQLNSYYPDANEFQLSLSYSATAYGGEDTREVQMSGAIGKPGPGSYPIGVYNTNNKINASYFIVSGSQYYNSLAGGLLTITKFDTVNNLVSGTFRFTSAKDIDPNVIDTISGVFSNAGIAIFAFGQGNLTATVGSRLFQPTGGPSDYVDGNMPPNEPLLRLEGYSTSDSGLLNISLHIIAPHVGTFVLGDATTPGTAACYYSNTSRDRESYSTQGHPNSGTLTITSFDPVNRRISGTFSATTFWYLDSNKTLPITNGVIDNVTWVQY